MTRNDSYINATGAFEDIYKNIMRHGVTTKIGTKALYNVGFFIKHPWDRVITTPWRKFNVKYAEREYEWYTSGNRSVEEIKKYAPLWDKMHGGDNIVNSNYGYQWRRNCQLARVMQMLHDDPNSRRAWITIYDGKELDDYKYDTPCTLSVGFDITPGINALNMTVIMRSNDLIYGFCNDQYCWTKLQEEMASKLNLGIGTYYHFAHDMHVYEKHWHLDLN